MIKNATLYRLGGQALAFEAVQQALAAHTFAPCGPTQERAIGWVPPRGQAHGALLEAVAGHWIARLTIELKSVPASALQRAVDAMAEAIEQSTGRKPGRKERKQLKEDALLELLPKAFPKQTSVLVWIDPQAGLLVTDASTQARSDETVTALVQALDGLALSLLQTAVAPQAAMAQWLTATGADQLPLSLAVERSCELQSDGEEKSTVRFARHNLATDEIRQHIAEGKLPTRLALNWDGRVSFVLTQGGQLKQLKFLDLAIDAAPGKDQDSFDADVALMTGELSQLIPDLTQALGGEVRPA